MRLLSSFVLRYLLQAHRDNVIPARAQQLDKEFATRSRFEVVKAGVKHQQFAIRRTLQE